MDRSRQRLLDADFNRAREALRLVEDYARFILNDTRLSQAAKQLRHDLCQYIGELSAEQLIACRDIVDDVGTEISTETELSRPDSFSVLQAACRRLTEAIRCLEEYSKIDSPELAGKIESLRYSAYQLEKQIISRANVAESFAGVRLYVLLTERLCRLPILEVAQQVLTGGADCIQEIPVGCPAADESETRPVVQPQ